jgi:hypothetical protein
MRQKSVELRQIGRLATFQHAMPLKNRYKMVYCNALWDVMAAAVAASRTGTDMSNEVATRHEGDCVFRSER